MSNSFFDFLHANKSKTFRPKKKIPSGTLRYNLHKQANASLHAGQDLRSSVRLPVGENLDDWLAVHVVDFFNRINLLYGTVADCCTPTTCPTMSGGPKYEYLWQDGDEYKRPTQLPATQYIAHLMDWIESQINNEAIFPTDTAVPFPKDFQRTCKKILTRLFRVFVHVYIHHFERMVQIGASQMCQFTPITLKWCQKCCADRPKPHCILQEPHANTCYKHFYYLVTEFNLIEAKELEPLKEMTERLLQLPVNSQQSRQSNKSRHSRR